MHGTGEYAAWHVPAVEPKSPVETASLTPAALEGLTPTSVEGREERACREIMCADLKECIARLRYGACVTHISSRCQTKGAISLLLLAVLAIFPRSRA